MDDKDALGILCKRMKDFTRDNKVIVITAKARPMTEAEIAAANTGPKFIDYIGMLK